MSKLSQSLFFQLVANETPKEKLQVISFHPGAVYNDEYKAFGFTPETFPYEKGTLNDLLALNMWN